MARGPQSHSWKFQRTLTGPRGGAILVYACRHCGLERSDRTARVGACVHRQTWIPAILDALDPNRAVIDHWLATSCYAPQAPRHLRLHRGLRLLGAEPAAPPAAVPEAVPAPFRTHPYHRSPAVAGGPQPEPSAAPDAAQLAALLGELPAATRAQLALLLTARAETA